MTTLKLIDLLEKQGVLDEGTAGDLRRQVGEAKYSVTPEVIVDLLVDNGLLTAEHGRKMIDLARADQAVSPGSSKQPPNPPAKPKIAVDSMDDLLSDPLQADKPRKIGAKPARPQELTSAGEFASAEAAEGVGTPTKKTPVKRPAAPPPELEPLGRRPAAPSPTTPAPEPLDLEPLGVGPLGAADPFGEGATDLGEVEKNEPPAKKSLDKKRAAGWDSALMLVGGGGVAVLILLFGLLYFALTRGSADEFLKKGDEDYRGGSYASAASAYEKFLKAFPGDANESMAKVRIGMARLRQAFDGAKDMSFALRAAGEVLPTIENEKSFDATARSELETILPDIADNFATQAKSADNPETMRKSLDKAVEAMKLVNNPTYLPSTRRKNQQTRIDAINEKMRVAERAVNQDAALTKALEEMQKHTTAGDAVAAYRTRHELLQSYPALEKYAQVVEAVRAVSNRERELAKPLAEYPPAATDDPHVAAIPRIVTAHRSGDSIASAAGQTYYELVDGAVYGIEAGSGKIRWRRYLGADTLIRPQTLANAGGDALLADQTHHELLRVSAASGKVVWRASIGERFLAPTVWADQIWLATPSGKVMLVPLEGGEAKRGIQLPQATFAPTAIDAKRKAAYQIGDHSTIFLLDTDGAPADPLTAKASYYLGHKAGSITTAPAVALGYLFVFENAGADFSFIHILGPAEEGGGLQAVNEPIKVQGRITLPASVHGRRVTVISDLGEVRIFDVDPANPSNPITLTAKAVADRPKPSPGYHVVDGAKLWIADRRLSDYEIQAARQTLDRGKSQMEGDAFVGPLQIFGRTLVHSRRRKGSLGVTVTGVNLATPSESWRLDLAAPLVTALAQPEKKRFTAITTNGDVFEVTGEHFKEGLRDATMFSTDSTVGNIVLQSGVTTSDGRIVHPDQEGRKWLLYPPETPNATKIIVLKTPSAVAPGPIACGKGIAAALVSGSIWLLDPTTGGALDKCVPFQPTVDPQVKVAWLPLAAIEEKQFVAIDASQRKLYVVRLDDQPAPQLVQSRSIDLAFEPVGSPAVVGNSLYVVSRGQTSDEVLSFTLPALEPGPKWDLGGRAHRGFDRVGETAFLESSTKELWRFGSGNMQLGKSAISIAPLSGPPVRHGDDFVLTGVNGSLTVLRADGTESKPIVTGESLGASSQAFGSRLLTGGADGTLLIVPLKVD